MSKRLNYISWDEYFMGIALLSAQRSKDPSTQVGACIVNKKNKIVGAGYNGLPAGCNDDQFPWHREGKLLDTKYPYVCHAELNAILNNIGIDLHDCRLYTTLFPCNECAKAIIQSGISEVIYLSDKYAGSDGHIASKKMLDAAGITCRKMKSDLQKLTLFYVEE
jgi:dCMP deaminase